jgi:hypothetical protein
VPKLLNPFKQQVVKGTFPEKKKIGSSFGVYLEHHYCGGYINLGLI